MKKREFTQTDLAEFFLRDSDGDYLKDNGKSYDREPEIDGAQIFTEAEAMEVINENPDMDLEMVTVSDVLDVEEYELVEG